MPNSIIALESSSHNDHLNNFPPCIVLALPLSETSKQIINRKAEEEGHNSIVSNLISNEQIVKKKINADIKSALIPKNAVWTRDIYESGFSYPNPGICPNDGQDIRLG